MSDEIPFEEKSYISRGAAIAGNRLQNAKAQLDKGDMNNAMKYLLEAVDALSDEAEDQAIRLSDIENP